MRSHDLIPSASCSARDGLPRGWPVDFGEWRRGSSRNLASHKVVKAIQDHEQIGSIRPQFSHRLLRVGDFNVRVCLADPPGSLGVPFDGREAAPFHKTGTIRYKNVGVSEGIVTILQDQIESLLD